VRFDIVRTQKSKISSKTQQGLKEIYGYQKLSILRYVYLCRRIDIITVSSFIDGVADEHIVHFFP